MRFPRRSDHLVLCYVRPWGTALIVGGNGEAGTMYAAYDRLERMGFVFPLT